MLECLEQFKLRLEDTPDDDILSSPAFGYVQQEIKPAWGSAVLAAPKEQVGWTGA